MKRYKCIHGDEAMLPADEDTSQYNTWVKYKDVKQFKDILNELEWSGGYTAEDGSEIDRSCPICRNEKYQGHKEDCRLNNLLVGEGN
jgi:hypothetical protein